MHATSRNYHAFMSCTAAPGWLPEAQLQLGAWLRDRENIDIDLSGDVLLDTAMGRLFNRGLRPWRFSDQDYLEALSSTDTSSTLALTGEPPETPWSPGLSSAMRSHGRAVHEEAIMELLLHDLA